MEIDAALNPGIEILEVVGKAADARQFVSRCWVEVGVASAAVDGAVTEAEVGDAVWIVFAYGNVSGRVGHPVVNACVPLQRNHRRQVADSRQRVRDASHASGSE